MSETDENDDDRDHLENGEPHWTLHSSQDVDGCDDGGGDGENESRSKMLHLLLTAKVASPRCSGSSSPGSEEPPVL